MLQYIEGLNQPLNPLFTNRNSRYTCFANHSGRLVTGSDMSKEVCMYNIDNIDRTQKMWGVKNRSGYTQRILTRRDQIVVGTTTGGVEFWDVGTQSSVQSLLGHRKPILDIIVDLVDPNLLVTTAQDKTIKIWDVREPHENNCVKSQKFLYQPYSLEICTNNIVTGLDNGTIFILDKDLRTNKILSNNSGIVSNLLVTNGKLFASCQSKTIKVYSLPDYKCESILSGHTGQINNLLSFDNLPSFDNLLVSTEYNKRIMVWNHMGNNVYTVGDTVDTENYIRAAIGIKNKIIVGSSGIDVYRVCVN